MPLPYSDTARSQALELYRTAGAVEASRQSGIPRRTISRWAKDAGIVPQANQQKTTAARATAAERIAVEWSDYRSQEATSAGAAAARMRRETLEASAAGDAGLLRARVIAYGIFIDKAELLSGQATERIELWAETELDRSLKDLVEEMESKIREETAP